MSQPPAGAADGERSGQPLQGKPFDGLESSQAIADWLRAVTCVHSVAVLLDDQDVPAISKREDGE